MRVRQVDEDGEWCAEAYLETDYGSLTKKDFESLVREYAIFDAIAGYESETEPNDAAS